MMTEADHEAAREHAQSWAEPAEQHPGPVCVLARGYLERDSYEARARIEIEGLRERLEHAERNLNHANYRADRAEQGRGRAEREHDALKEGCACTIADLRERLERAERRHVSKVSELEIARHNERVAAERERDCERAARERAEKESFVWKNLVRDRDTQLERAERERDEERAAKEEAREAAEIRHDHVQELGGWSGPLPWEPTEGGE